MRSRSLFSNRLVMSVASFGTMTVLLFSTTPAEAREGSKTVIALDLDFAAGLDEPSVDAGGGGALRLGRDLDLLVLSLTPEIGGGYHTFTGDREATIYRGFVGGRLALGKIVEPSVFTHIGIGRLDTSFDERTAPTFDAGLALDFTLLPLLDLGAHASYNAMFATEEEEEEAFDWYALGLHVALVF